MMPAEFLYRISQYQTEHYKKFWENLVDINCEAWLNIYWGYIKVKSIAVHLYPWSLGCIVLVFLTYVREGGPL